MIAVARVADRQRQSDIQTGRQRNRLLKRKKKDNAMYRKPCIKRELLGSERAPKPLTAAHNTKRKGVMVGKV